MKYFGIAIGILSGFIMLVAGIGIFGIILGVVSPTLHEILIELIS